MTAQPEPTWATARLVARPAAIEDASAMFAGYASDPEVAKYMMWTPHRSVDDTRAFLSRCERSWRDGSGYAWTLRRAEDGAFVGLIEIRVTETAVDLGYALGRRWWRQGLMKEAVTAVVQWALAQPAIYRVWATCDIDNLASARLLESVGMQQEGILRRWILHPNISHEPRDSFCYSIVK